PPPARPERIHTSETFRAQATEVGQDGYLRDELPRLSQDEIDRRVRLNTNAPILYKVGAGNISFETTFQQSNDILGKIENFSGSQYLYREGMVIYWREDRPETPDSIIIISGYQGALSFPETFGGQARVAQSFASAFSTGFENPAEDPKAQGFIKAIYNHLEGT